jgi:hypothetical protein
MHLDGHPGDQKLVAVEDSWPFRTDCFTRECLAEDQKQIGCNRKMDVRLVTVGTDLTV